MSFLFAGLAGIGPSAAEGPAAVPASDSPEFFAAKVAPLLTTHCVACHGTEKQEGGLRLDSLAGLSAGGEAGPVIVPGSAAESVLAGAVGYADEALAMPPTGSFPTRLFKRSAPGSMAAPIIRQDGSKRRH